MSRRELCSFRWNGTQWAAVSASSPLESESKPVSMNQQNTNPTVDETVRVATFNVLADCFPWFIEMAIRSPERFEWLCNGITILNPTIIGLNEVTATALDQLQQCSFIRENYFITESFNETKNDDIPEPKSCTNGLLSPHGSVILSKLPLLEVFAISVSGSSREAVVGKVQIGSNLETCVYFCAQHTTAYQTPKNAQLRTQQIRDIVDVLQPLGIPFVIMGDLNLHYQFEDAIVIDNKFIDAWAQTHFSHTYPFNDENEGYTFDAVKNSLIPYYIPGERRQMRLDRILFSRGFPAFAITPCTIWANEPIRSGNYLFPSDHFGLFIDIVTDLTDDSRKTISLGEPDPTAEEILYRNAKNNKDRKAYQLGLIQRTTALASHVLWLGAVALGLK
jgi:endonuclease/exonuclease/phosphatase family metal-dependent hydrolase